MSGYASERDGDYYSCACGETTKHSYLLSSRSGFVSECCREKGWDYFEHKGIWLTKTPDQTIEERKQESDNYYEWVRGVDWEKYYSNKDYREEMSRHRKKNCK